MSPFDIAQRVFHHGPISLCHHCGPSFPHLLLPLRPPPTSPHPPHTSTAPFKDKSHYRALLLSCSRDSSFAYIRLLSNYTVLPKRAQQRSHDAEEDSFSCNKSYSRDRTRDCELVRSSCSVTQMSLKDLGFAPC